MVKPRAVAICVVCSVSGSDDEPAFLLASSRKHAGRYVFPKGGIEPGETSVQAAVREAGEEAGLKSDAVAHVASLGTMDDSKPHAKDASIPSTVYHVELFRLREGVSTDDALERDWLESHERERTWVTGYEQVKEHVVWGRRAEVCTNIVQKAKDVIDGQQRTPGR